jgi:hypothetical protein
MSRARVSERMTAQVSVERRDLLEGDADFVVIEDSSIVDRDRDNHRSRDGYVVWIVRDGYSACGPVKGDALSTTTAWGHEVQERELA